MNLLTLAPDIQGKVLFCIFVSFCDDSTHERARGRFAAMLNRGAAPAVTTARSGCVNKRSSENQAARESLKTTGDTNQRCARWTFRLIKTAMITTPTNT